MGERSVRILEAILLGGNIVRAFWDGSAAHHVARFVDGES
jgi:hypothetical protein